MKFGPRRVTRGQEWSIFFCGVAGLVESVIEVVTLGRYTAYIRMHYLLSDFCDRLRREGKK